MKVGQDYSTHSRRGVLGNEATSAGTEAAGLYPTHDTCADIFSLHLRYNHQRNVHEEAKSTLESSLLNLLLSWLLRICWILWPAPHHHLLYLWAKCTRYAPDTPLVLFIFMYMFLNKQLVSTAQITADQVELRFWDWDLNCQCYFVFVEDFKEISMM